jgi:hypothetical protein
MKKIGTKAGKIESADVALWLGLSIGLGIAVHEGFFLIAGAIAVGALTAVAVHAVHEFGGHHQLAEQHR